MSKDSVTTLESALSVLKSMADTAYCRSLDLYQKQECLGLEHKMQMGWFKQPEYEAHKKAIEQMARHSALCEAIKVIRQEFEYVAAKESA